MAGFTLVAREDRHARQRRRRRPARQGGRADGRAHADQPVDARPVRGADRRDRRHLPRGRRAPLLRRRQPERGLRHLAARRHGLRHHALQPAQDVLAAARRRRAGRRAGGGAARPRAVPARAGRRPRRRHATGSTTTGRSRSAGCAGSAGRSASSCAPTRSCACGARACATCPRSPCSTPTTCWRGCADAYDLPVDRHCMHEFVVSARDLKREHGITALDVAKRLMDHGFHPPTIYFPLIVPEALMIEPTETETRETLDAFCDAMLAIAQEAADDPQMLKDAPHTRPVSAAGRGRGGQAAARPLRLRRPPDVRVAVAVLRGGCVRLPRHAGRVPLGRGAAGDGASGAGRRRRRRPRARPAGSATGCGGGFDRAPDADLAELDYPAAVPRRWREAGIDGGAGRRAPRHRGRVPRRGRRPGTCIPMRRRCSTACARSGCGRPSPPTRSTRRTSSAPTWRSRGSPAASMRRAVVRAGRAQAPSRLLRGGRRGARRRTRRRHVRGRQPARRRRRARPTRACGRALRPGTGAIQKLAGGGVTICTEPLHVLQILEGIVESGSAGKI